MLPASVVLLGWGNIVLSFFFFNFVLTEPVFAAPRYLFVVVVVFSFLICMH